MNTIEDLVLVVYPLLLSLVIVSIVKRYLRRPWPYFLAVRINSWWRSETSHVKRSRAGYRRENLTLDATKQHEEQSHRRMASNDV